MLFPELVNEEAGKSRKDDEKYAEVTALPQANVHTDEVMWPFPKKFVLHLRLGFYIPLQSLCQAKPVLLGFVLSVR